MEKILANTVYSDSTLKRWKKEDLIEHIRILEHNWASAEESLANSVKNADKIFYEQKAEIERLKNAYKEGLAQGKFDSQVKIDELQKQVDELSKEKARLDKNVKWYQEKIENGELVSKQAVKDTAKEILCRLWNIGFEGVDRLSALENGIQEIAKEKGVEVK